MRFPTLAVALLTVSCGLGRDVVFGGRLCTGCRDADGTCFAGTEVTACGREGDSCQVCGNGLACFDGRCGGLDGGRLQSVGGGGGGDPHPSLDGGLEDDCSAEAKLIYVVDQDRKLSSFDPRALGGGYSPFAEHGRLSCPTEPGAEPFSMAVDRTAVAWVIYDSGELFRVDLKTSPPTCMPTAYQPSTTIAMFGMGFASDGPGSKEEQLYIAGSSFGSSLSRTTFGVLNPLPPHNVMARGQLEGAPELTGTGDGKLWAFFPNVTPPRVSQLSKTDGQAISSFTAPMLMGAPRAWAFAFWGGDFYIFLERSSDPSTNVWRLRGDTGDLSLVVPNSGRRIVGAGVSTCAPLQIN